MDVIETGIAAHAITLALPREDHDALHRGRTAREQAIFRLGQMDMRESIADMLEAEACNNALGLVAVTLRVYADKTRAMEIPGGRVPGENT